MIKTTFIFNEWFCCYLRYGVLGVVLESPVVYFICSGLIKTSDICINSPHYCIVNSVSALLKNLTA